jgi:hypothetical protein
MKGAYLLSNGRRFFDEAEAAFQYLGATIDPEVMQLRDDQGRLFTVFNDVDDLTYQWRQGRVRFVDDGPLPDVSTAKALWIECRWNDLFASVLKQVAEKLSAPAWVLDNNYVLWPAAQIDPTRLEL